MLITLRNILLTLLALLGLVLIGLPHFPAHLAGWFIFRLFDFINKHHFIGTFAYILLLSGFIAGSSAAIETTETSD